MRKKINSENNSTDMSEDTLEKLSEVTQMVDKLSTQVNFMIQESDLQGKNGFSGLVVKLIKKYGVYSSVVIGAVSISWYISSFINDIYQFTEISYKKIENIIGREESVSKQLEVIKNNQDITLRNQDKIKELDMLLKNQDAILRNQEKIMNTLSTIDKELEIHIKTGGDSNGG